MAKGSIKIDGDLSDWMNHMHGDRCYTDVAFARADGEEGVGYYVMHNGYTPGSADDDFNFGFPKIEAYSFDGSMDIVEGTSVVPTTYERYLGYSGIADGGCTVPEFPKDLPPQVWERFHGTLYLDGNFSVNPNKNALLHEDSATREEKSGIALVKELARRVVVSKGTSTASPRGRETPPSSSGGASDARSSSAPRARAPARARALPSCPSTCILKL